MVYRDGLGPVFGSLYARPAQVLRARGYDNEVVSMAPLGEYVRREQRRRWRQRRRTMSDVFAGPIHRIPVAPSRLQRFFSDSRSLAFHIRMRHRRRDLIVLHCGGALACNEALDARELLPGYKVRIVFHSLGPLADEFTYGMSANEKDPLPPQAQKEWERRDRIEERAYSHADSVVCISEAMKQHAVEFRGVDRGRIVKIPCLVDSPFFRQGMSARQRMRRSLGVEDRFVVVYMGALHPWQKPECIPAVFNAVLHSAPDAHLLVVTRETAKAERLMRAADLCADDWTLASGDYVRMPEYLAAADLGILLRGLFEGRTRVNAFSSPIKYAEYLASGVPVLLPDHVGDYSEWTREHGCGVVVPSSSTPSSLAEDIAAEIVRIRDNRADLLRGCTELAARRLDLTANIDLYDQAYRVAMQAIVDPG